MKNREITAVLEAEGGFTQKMKMKSFLPYIKIPLFHRLKLNTMIIGDTIDFDISQTAEFYCYKRTKKFAWYKLANVGEVKAIKL